jgi:hypothetical protein
MRMPPLPFSHAVITLVFCLVSAAVATEATEATPATAATINNSFFILCSCPDCGLP